MNKYINKCVYRFIMLTVVAMVGAIFFGCNNGDAVLSLNIDSVSQDKPVSAKVVFRAETAAESRSAKPNQALEDFSCFIITINDPKLPSADPSADTTILGIWDTYTELQDASIDVQTGEWEFTMGVFSKSMVYSATTTAVIKEGSNTINFVLMSVGDFTELGYGSLRSDVVFPPANVKAVTAGLYTLNEQLILGFADEDLSFAGGRAAYNKDEIPVGDYMLIYRFYADTEKKLLVGTYREYAGICQNMTSESSYTMTRFAKINTINYDLKDGQFVVGYTPQLSYTVMSDSIILPTADKLSKSTVVPNIVSWEFGGWYDNDRYTGDAVTAITSGSSGNKTFYARWFPQVVITYNANGGTFDSTADIHQTVCCDVSTDLYSSLALGLTNGTKRFLGWAESANAASAKYADGGNIRISQPLTLYAVWTLTNIDPDDRTKDTDGDGIPDYQEINEYHTDPTNPDTDGDGWNDYEELHGLYNQDANTFNPRIADIPKLKLKITSKPYIEYKYTLTSGNTETVSQTLTEGTVQSQSNTQTNSKTSGHTRSLSLQNSTSVKHSFGAVGTPNTMSWEVQDTFSIGANNSWSNSDTYTYSRNESHSFSQNISNGKTKSSSSSKTWSGGKVKINVQVENMSNLAYKIDNIEFVLSRTPINLSSGMNIPVGSKSKSGIVLAPHESSNDIEIEIDNLSVEETEQMLKWSSELIIEISGYTLSIQKNMDSTANNNFTGALTRVMNKCASVSIDYGPGNNQASEEYMVSTRYKYNLDAVTPETMYVKPNLLEILEDVLHLTRDSGKLVLSNDDRLWSLRSVETKSDPNALSSKVEEGSWYISHIKLNDTGKYIEDLYDMTYNRSGAIKKLEDIVVSPSDSVHIFYNVDRDGDGVPLNYELRYGTSDDNIDTDGDGLTDFEEIFGWYGKGKLDAKYTQNARCYTKPLLVDTDGDDLLDYIKDYDTATAEQQETVDNDPVIPKILNIAEIKSASYSASSDGTFTPIVFNGQSASLSGLYEYIYLDVEPKLSYSEVHYQPDNETLWKPLDKNTPIKLNIETNTIKVRITAPDGLTVKEFNLTVNSSFNVMNNFILSADKFSDNGKVKVRWDSYADARIDASSDSGYVLYAEKSSTVNKNRALTRDKTAGLSSTDAITTAGVSSFYKSLSSGDLSGGLLSLNVDVDTEYCMYLYAYFGTKTEASYRYKLLGCDKIKSGKTKNGIFKFYAHYIKNVKEHDDGPKGEYYWKFSDTFGMKKFDVAESNAVEMKDNTYWPFTNRNVTSDDPGRDKSNAYVYELVLDRTSQYTYQLEWDPWEDDGLDDHLGNMKLIMTYDPKNDTWTCKTVMWIDNGKTTNNTYTLKAGQKSDGNYEGIYDSDGEVEFHWDWSWSKSGTANEVFTTVSN